MRYAFYGFKGAQYGILGHLRYNTFWILYPCGVGAEVLCFIAARKYVLSIEPETDRPYTILMPNKLNFELKYQWMINFIFVAYTVGFPMLYLHMISQRRRFYQKRAEALSDNINTEDDDAYVGVN